MTKWTEAEIAHLCRNYEVRGPVAIASELERSYGSVTTKAHVLGVTADTRGHGGRHPYRRLSVPQVKGVLGRLHGRGRISAAARDLGVSRSALVDYVRRHPEVDEQGVEGVGMYQVELVWNREFDFVPHGETKEVLEDAIKYARAVENMGDGACVKKTRIVDDEGVVVWEYGRRVKSVKREGGS